MNLNSFLKVILIFVLGMSYTSNQSVQAAEVKIGDLVRFQDGRVNQVTGFGLVVGLNNSGDLRSPFTEQALSNYLNSLGVDTKVRPKETRNIASVMITAHIPSWAKPGDRVDVLVSSIGDARSLEGGVLVQSPLKAANGEIIAVASGSLQDPNQEQKDNKRGYFKKKKASNSALILNGGIIEKGIVQPSIIGKTTTANIDLEENSSEEIQKIRMVLNSPNLSSINAILSKINAIYSDSGINPIILNAREMELEVPKDKNLLEFIAELELLTVELNTPSRVVINQKSGTVVMGGNLVMDEVAISKTGLKLQLESRGKSRYFWSEFDDKSESVFYVKKINNVKTLVEELNRLGAGTEDIISILQGLNRSGILHAEVIVE